MLPAVVEAAAALAVGLDGEAAVFVRLDVVDFAALGGDVAAGVEALSVT